MSLQALSPSKHLKHGFSLPKNFSFAKSDSVSIINIDEITTLMPIYALAFAKVSSEQLVLVCIQSLYTNDNIFIDENGRWKVSVIPNTYKSYPFVFADTKEKENILCFNTDSGLYRENPNLELKEERFFDDDGNIQKKIEDVLTFLTNSTKYKKITIKALDIIMKSDILEPWNIGIKDNPTDKEPIKGLYRVNQEKLNALSAEKLEKLNKSYALSIIYGQLLSIPRIDTVAKLYKMKNQEESKKIESEKTLDELFSDSSHDSISFNF